MLSLRNPLDTTPTVSSGVKTASLFGQTPVEQPPPVQKPVARKAPVQKAAPVEPPPAPPKAYTVEAIRAAKRSEEVVR